MNWDAIIAVAEVLGVIAVVISLIYVGLQVRQNTLQLRHDNLLASIRGTLESNWLYHRDPATFEIFRKGVRSFDALSPQEQAVFHSIIVDITFYLETVRSMVTAGLIDPNALAINNKFLVATLITPGGQEWWAFARKSPPMPQPAMEYIESLLESQGDSTPPITELQPWFGQ